MGLGTVPRTGLHGFASRVLLSITVVLAGLLFLCGLMSIWRTWTYRHSELVFRLDDATLWVSRMSHYGLESAIEQLTSKWKSNLGYVENVHYCIAHYRDIELLERQWASLLGSEAKLIITQQDHDDWSIQYLSEHIQSCATQLDAVIENTQELRDDIAGEYEEYYRERLVFPDRSTYVARLEEQHSWLKQLRSEHEQVLEAVTLGLKTPEAHERNRDEKQFPMGDSFARLWQANEESSNRLSGWRATFDDWRANPPKVPRPRFWSTDSTHFRFVVFPAFTAWVPGVWDVVVPLWLPFLFLCILLAGIMTPSYRARGRLRRGECQRCGYSLNGLTDPRCPECGELFDQKREQIVRRDDPTRLVP